MQTEDNVLEIALELAASEPAHRPEFFRLLLESTLFIIGSTEISKTAQVICWDRGRPARNEREARKVDVVGQKLRACGALRAGRPRSQQIA